MEKINKIEQAWQQLIDWRALDISNRQFFIEFPWDSKDPSVVEVQLIDIKISGEVICLAIGTLDQAINETLNQYNKLKDNVKNHTRTND